MVTVLKHVHFNKSSKSLYYISLASRFIILDNIITIIRFAYKRFPSRSCNLTGKSWTQFYFFLRKKDKRFFLYYDKLILFSRSCSCSCCKKDDWKPTIIYFCVRGKVLILFIFLFHGKKLLKRPENRETAKTFGP